MKKIASILYGLAAVILAMFVAPLVFLMSMRVPKT
jgi:hypothetical protein